jgi:regulatory protein RepA
MTGMDRQNKNPSRYSRMTDAKRAVEFEWTATGVWKPTRHTWQRLLDVNAAGKSWDEWSEWTNTLDRNVLPKLVSWLDFSREEHNKPAPKMIIEGVLNQGAKMTVGGASKAGKTWLLMDLAFAVVTGRPWLGLPTVRGEVLYVNLEIQPHFFNKRGQLILKERKINPRETEGLSLWNLRGRFMTAQKFREEITAAIGDQKFDLIDERLDCRSFKDQRTSK